MNQGEHDAATPNKRASGGPIVGPGTQTSDSIPLWGSDAEYMHHASSVDYYCLHRGRD